MSGKRDAASGYDNDVIDPSEMYESIMKSKAEFGLVFDELTVLFLRHVDTLLQADERFNYSDIKRLYSLYEGFGYEAKKKELDELRKKHKQEKLIREQIIKDSGMNLNDMIKKMLRSKRVKKKYPDLKVWLSHFKEKGCIDAYELNGLQKAWEEYKRPVPRLSSQDLRKISRFFLITGAIAILVWVTVVLMIAISSVREQYRQNSVAKIFCGRYTAYLVSFEDKGDHWEGIKEDGGDKLYVPKNLCVVEFYKGKK